MIAFLPCLFFWRPLELFTELYPFVFLKLSSSLQCGLLFCDIWLWYLFLKNPSWVCLWSTFVILSEWSELPLVTMSLHFSKVLNARKYESRYVFKMLPPLRFYEENSVFKRFTFSLKVFTKFFVCAFKSGDGSDED